MFLFAAASTQTCRISDSLRLQNAVNDILTKGQWMGETDQLATWDLLKTVQDVAAWAEYILTDKLLGCVAMDESADDANAVPIRSCAYYAPTNAGARAGWGLFNPRGISGKRSLKEYENKPGGDEILARAAKYGDKTPTLGYVYEGTSSSTQSSSGTTLLQPFSQYVPRVRQWNLGMGLDNLMRLTMQRSCFVQNEATKTKDGYPVVLSDDYWMKANLGKNCYSFDNEPINHFR